MLSSYPAPKVLEEISMPTFFNDLPNHTSVREGNCCPWGYHHQISFTLILLVFLRHHFFSKGVGNVIFIMFTTANHILCSVPAWFTNGFLWKPMWKWIQSSVSGWACLRVLYFLLLTEGPFLTLFSSFAAKQSTGLLLMLVAWSWVAVNENETYSDLSHRARSRQRNEP